MGGNQRTQREPTKHGENMKTPHRKSPDRWWSQTLLIGPSCGDTTVLPCTPFYTNCNLLLLFGITEKIWTHMIQNRGSLSGFHRSNWDSVQIQTYSFLQKASLRYLRLFSLLHLGVNAHIVLTLLCTQGKCKLVETCQLQLCRCEMLVTCVPVTLSSPVKWNSLYFI